MRILLLLSSLLISGALSAQTDALVSIPSVDRGQPLPISSAIFQAASSSTLTGRRSAQQPGGPHFVITRTMDTHSLTISDLATKGRVQKYIEIFYTLADGTEVTETLIHAFVSQYAASIAPGGGSTETFRVYFQDRKTSQ